MRSFTSFRMTACVELRMTVIIGKRKSIDDSYLVKTVDCYSLTIKIKDPGTV